eukprot:41632-Eustigmatos_ZCMA.PRE.1
MDAKLLARPALDGKKLFDEVCSDDPLGFTFSGRSYRSQLTDAIAKTEVREHQSQQMKVASTMETFGDYCLRILSRDLNLYLRIAHHAPHALSQGFAGVDVYLRNLR